VLTGAAAAVAWGKKNVVGGLVVLTGAAAAVAWGKKKKMLRMDS
jgi:hypothetical protein